MPLYGTIGMQLLTPNNKLFTLSEAGRKLSYITDDAVLGAFLPADNYNFAWCKIPFQDFAGDRCLCAFKFNNPEEKIVVVEGTTVRINDFSGFLVNEDLGFVFP
jgi:hypothetical protein